MQNHQNLPVRSHRVILFRKCFLLALTLLLSVLTIALSATQVQASTVTAASANEVDGQRKAYGIVEDVAGDSFIGHWTIDEQLYLVTFHTKLKPNGSMPEIGNCVEVKYYGHASVRIAKQITAVEENICTGADDGNDPSDDADSDDDSENNDGEEDEMPQETEMSTGVVENMPGTALIGGWVIGGAKYVTNSETKFEQNEGSLVTGSCVEVKYSGSSAPFTILKIETEDPEECMDDGTVVMPPTGDLFKDYGRIEALPDDPSLQGEWTVNGVTYLVTNATKIRKWYGQFTVGTCVKVLYRESEPPFVAHKIQTSKRHFCGGQNDNQGFARGLLFGQIRDFPEELSGDWNVGGMTFEASDSTNFNQRKGSFGEGVTVRVKFYIDDDGVHQATDIKTMFRLWHDDDGHNDDGDNDDGDDGDNDDGDNDDGDNDDVRGHAFGTITNYPANLVGEWNIGGIDYTATADTIFHQRKGDFGVDVPVRVRYYINEDGNRIATQIKTISGTATIPGRHKLCGFINTIPAFGFTGGWSIDGVTLQAEDTAEFEEALGLLGLGSYAEVEYGERNGRYYIHKIKSQVPPGGGDNNLIGTFTRRAGTSDGVEAASTDADSETWQIAGQSYLVTPATDLDEQNGELFVGNTVAVNSYTDADGNEVATKINTVVASPATFFDTFIYLPMMNQ